MATDKSLHLQQVLETHRMAHIEKLLDKYKEKRQEVKEALEENYKDKIYNPINSGSYAKSTHINTKFDLDIVAPFKKKSFDSIEIMYNAVFDFLYEKYKDVAEVRKQKVSVGIIFFEDEDGDVIDIDVVPGRETSENNYMESKDLNIYFNENTLGFGKGTYTKTNIQAQIDHIKGKTNAREIIRLLKIWKNGNHPKDYKSFLFELVTIEAFNKEEITGNLWDKLKSVLEYIRDNVTKDNFILKDPGNGNNDVASTLSQIRRIILSDRMTNMINNIENNSDNIKTYFPINEEFEEDENKGQYGLKDVGIVAPSIPNKSQQFG